MTTASTAQPPSSDGYLGRILDDRYRLDAVIGAGAIGKVYAGTQLAVDRKVAIKLLHPSVQDRELGTERFLREAKAVARLSHATCLTLFDFGLDEALNCFYMVTEFVQGETLAEYMARGRLDPEQVYYLLFQIGTALEHAHEAGILHRDLKPENIMLVKTLESSAGSFASIKVLDFGLARIREEAATPLSELLSSSAPNADSYQAGALDLTTPIPSRLTHFGELNGTPAYMSPEQCRGELELTPACDYYALGVLAYELFEGRLPYEAGDIAQLLAMHLEAPIPPMTAGRVPEDIEEMLYRLMAKDAAYRLQSSSEILETLRAHMAPESAQRAVMSSLDRFQPSQTPVHGNPAAPGGDQTAVSGAETLVHYDPSDTPIPAPIARKPRAAIEFSETLVAGDVPGEAARAGWKEGFKSYGPKATGFVAAGLLLVLLAGGTMAWWAQDLPVDEAAESVDASVMSASAEPEDLDEAQAQPFSAEEAPAQPETNADAPPEADGEPTPSEAADAAPAEGEPESSSRPEPPINRARPKERKRRPRKLELTY